ncbi:TetR/AcrR family transcriptional regulator C-terminal domain-containing protein [Actinomadura luteofluorescens]|uniref:TetR/AcrR family transcriptional regulator n=1 Tax=Actinomadura luteofluorescens TaxID=46163 RepID=UPI002164A2DB|nr:TetR/AcrR family transcriptional regulator [Actinomadura glauciflava]MCR3740450.1 transcriptional regulator, TetR family [Actinomadura glauciflava]
MGTSRAGDIWSKQPRGRREAPPLSRERIVAEAVALLDEEGADRLTMRRLAERLGTGSTTLYWHLDTKDDVLDLALDRVFAEAEVPPATDDWCADVTAMVERWRAVMLRHRWTATLMGRPMLGPNVLTRTEFLHAALQRAGLTGAPLTAAAYGLSHFVIGAAISQLSWHGGDEPSTRDTADKILAARRETYPTLAAHGHPSDNDWDDAFHRGLGYLIDGIRANGTG